MGFPAIAAGVGLAGAGISAYNQISAGNQAASALNASADQGPFNFLLSQAQASAARRAGQIAQEQGKMRGDTALAAAQAEGLQAARAGRIARSNLQAAAAFGGGNASSADVINLAGGIGAQSRYSTLVSLYNGEVARNEAIYQGQLANFEAQQRAAGFETQGIQSLAQSSLDRARASQVRNNAYASAAGTLLGQAASLGVGYKNAGGNISADASSLKSMMGVNAMPSKGYNYNYG